MLFIKDAIEVTARALLFAMGAALGILLAAYLLLGCGAATEEVDCPDAGEVDAGLDAGGDSDSDVDTDTDSDSDTESASESESNTEVTGGWSPCFHIEPGTSAFCGALCREAGLGDCANTCESAIDGNLHGSETGCEGATPSASACDTVWPSDGDDGVRCCCEALGG